MNLFTKFSLLLVAAAQMANTYAFEANSLNAKYFGVVKVEGKRHQVGLLTKEIPNEPGNYYGVLMEYLNPLHEDNFVADFVRPGKKKLFSSKKNGYLEELLHWVTIVKLVNVTGTNNYDIYSVKLANGKVVADSEIDQATFTSLGRAFFKRDQAFMNISLMGENREFFFKSQKRFPLKSTWEDHYSPGPYNPGYKQAGITILNLSNDLSLSTKKSSAEFNVSTLKGKTLNINGAMTMNHLECGMFTFTRNDASASGIGLEKVEDKIAVFVDVYDAKPVMNTVELILVDPSNPKNSQMYFEEFGNTTEATEHPLY